MNSSIRRKGEAGSGGGEQQVAATTMALELSSITENTLQFSSNTSLAVTQF